MTPAARVRSALEATGSRRNGKDWICPAHEDSRASLSVDEGREGKEAFLAKRPPDLSKFKRYS